MGIISEKTMSIEQRSRKRARNELIAIPDSDDYVDLTTNQTIDGVKTFNDAIKIGEGTAADPSIYQLYGVNKFGLYTTTPGENVSFAFGGLETLRLSSNQLTAKNGAKFICGEGDAVEPGFATSNGCGMFNKTSTTATSFATDGVERLTLNTASFDSTLPIRAPDGDVSTPSISLVSDTATGLYSSGTNSLSISSNGVQKMEVIPNWSNFDIYKEGTYSSTITGLANVSSIATPRTLTYTRIGNIVHCNLNLTAIVLSATGTFSFSITVPFAAGPDCVTGSNIFRSTNPNSGNWGVIDYASSTVFNVYGESTVTSFNFIAGFTYCTTAANTVVP
jgi:hypothetical protein